MCPGAPDPPYSPAADTRRARPQSVLFACSFNSVRSPMAEALARQLFAREIFFASAGLRAGERDPFATAVMDEIGIDLGKHRPQAFDDLEDMNFDLIISLSPEAHHRAMEYTRSLALDALFWPTIDPTAVQGSRETILDSYRSVRDALRKRIMAEFAWRPMGDV
jgi:protein-tyrosine-phosphatase